MQAPEIRTNESSPYSLAKVRSAIGYYLLGRGASALFGFATIILLVRFLSVNDYAAYIALTGLAGIAMMLSSLGLERVITRFVPEGRLYHSEKKLQSFVWKIALVRLAATLCVTMLMAGGWQWLVTLFAFINLDRMPWALAIFLVANSLFEILAVTLQALVLQKLLTQIMVLIWGGRLVAILYLANLQSGLGLEKVLWLMALPELAGSACLLIAVGMVLRHSGAASRIGQPPEDLNRPWPQWSETRNLAGHSYAFNILASVPQGYFMRTLVATTLPVEVVAAYGFFSSLVDKVRSYLPIQLMYNLFEPLLVARYLEDKDEHALSRHIRLMYKANLLVIMMALVFIAISGNTAINLATGGKFLEQSWILALLLVQVAFGSHVLAIQLIVNVLKLNKILSQAGTLALMSMLLFLALAHTLHQAMLLLYAVLIYSVTVNIFSLWRLTRCHAIYRAPSKETLILLATAAPLALIPNLAIKGFHMGSQPVMVLLSGIAAGMMLAPLALSFNFINKQDFILLWSAIKPIKKIRA